MTYSGILPQDIIITLNKLKMIEIRHKNGESSTLVNGVRYVLLYYAVLQQLFYNLIISSYNSLVHVSKMTQSLPSVP